MVFTYNGAEINYELIGQGQPTLLLHGWGGSLEVFNNLVSLFPDRLFIVPDFPPFGKSEKTIENWNIFTYASMVMSLCDHLKIEKCDVLGHSFGGRVTILLAALKKSLVKSCVLVDSAGMKPKRTFKYYLSLGKFKLARSLGFFVKDAGSQDYRALPENMKQTFISIVNTHLEDYARMILAPTLVVVGRNDKDTPIYMAKRLNRLIKKSRLVIFDDAGHYSFLDSPLVFYKEIKVFWEGV